MTNHKTISRSLLYLTAVLLLAVGAQAAERWPSSKLLLPCFEVRLDGSENLPPSLTTMLAVVNSADRRVPVRIAVLSNWGIEMLSTSLDLEPRQVKVINLADWILAGWDPGDPPGSPPALDEENLAHLQAALCGELSPMTGEFYSSAVDEQPPLRAVGSIVIHTRETRDNDVLFGDFFVVEPGQDFAQGEVLANLDPALVPGPDDDDDLCNIHAFRFLTGGGFDSGTEFMVWNTSRVTSSVVPGYPVEKIRATVKAYRENGGLLAILELELLPMQMVRVNDLALPGNFGWLKIDTFEVETMIGVRYNAAERYSVGMETFCLKREVSSGPSIDIEKSTNGVDADRAPGPRVAPGSSIEWRYEVTNTGDVPLTEIVVSDNMGAQPICPESDLEVGARMTCTARGIAEAACPHQYVNIGFVEGLDPTGRVVSDDDPSHYHLGEADIHLEKSTNGVDADQSPGECLEGGDAVTWTYVVTNTGDVSLTGVTVTDNHLGTIGTVASLAPGASRTLTAHGTVNAAQCPYEYENLGEVRADSACGEVSDSDLSRYECCPPPPPECGIDLEKSTNGVDADQSPGECLEGGDAVTWTYVVTNTGDVSLTGVTVTDNHLGTIGTVASLAPGASRTLTAHGTVNATQCPYEYENLGEVRADSACGEVSDSDLSRYECCPPQPPPECGIDLEKSTNGVDADQSPGECLEGGDAVTWTYVVTNTGDVSLTGVTVTDNHLGTIGTVASLAPGASRTLTAHGTVNAAQCPYEYENLGEVRADSACGEVSDSDLSRYQCCAPTPGRMTGGGSVFTNGDRYTHGFELHCDLSPPNNLEINWGKGDRFHLTSLTSGSCGDDPAISEAPPVAGFDTFIGTGTGRLNGVDGATITFHFTDAGEPGKDNDGATFTIAAPGGGSPITVSGRLQSGNHQAHGN